MLGPVSRETGPDVNSAPGGIVGRPGAQSAGESRLRRGDARACSSSGVWTAMKMTGSKKGLQGLWRNGARSSGGGGGTPGKVDRGGDHDEGDRVEWTRPS